MVSIPIQTQAVSAIPVQNTMVGHEEGNIEGYDPGIETYKKGAVMAWLIDPKEEAAIKDEFSPQIQRAQRALKDMENNSGVFSEWEISNQRLKAQQLKLELQKRLTEKAYRAIRAPHNLRVIRSSIVNGMHVFPGMQLFEYHDNDRVRFEFMVPQGSTYFYDITDLTVNGSPISRDLIFPVSWIPNNDGSGMVLSLIVDDPRISGGQTVELSGQLVMPQQDNKSPVKTSPASELVNGVRRDPVLASVDGTGSALVGEGQMVKKGQPMAQMDTSKQQEELRIVEDEISLYKREIFISRPGTNGKWIESWQD